MKRFTLIGVIIILMSIILVACASPTTETAPEAQTDNRQAASTVLVYKSPTCGCCSDWVEYLEEHGYTVTVEEVTDLVAIKQQYHVPPDMGSCHTALIDGYVIEGHVPVEDIERLLSERPDVLGIAVPGMPPGSPGMEIENYPPQPFEVLTFDVGGNATVYASYPQ
ncbi:MAG: DUF411 domain-containing protein [Chloroflexaceae bacterium]|nr:DUF411 domain-containing protein [Chloroflexaceae bacterium]